MSSFSKDSNQRGTSALAQTKVGIGLDEDAEQRRTLEQLRSVRQVNVLCSVGFASTFDSVDRDSLLQIMAAGGMPTKLLTLIKVNYASTKMKVRAKEG